MQQKALLFFCVIVLTFFAVKPTMTSSGDLPENAGVQSTLRGKSFHLSFKANRISLVANNANLKDVFLYDGEVLSATATKLSNSGETLSTSEFSPSIERTTEEGDHYIVNKTLSGVPLHWNNGEGDYQIFFLPGPFLSGT